LLVRFNNMSGQIRFLAVFSKAHITVVLSQFSYVSSIYDIQRGTNYDDCF